jgi:hypothetical protein
MRSKLLIAALVCWTLAACDPEKLFNQVEPVDFGPLESKLVPNYFLNNLDPTGVLVSNTVPSTGPQVLPKFIKDASVKLYENEVLKATFSFSTLAFDSVYRNSVVGTPGKYYTLEVSHPDYPTATGTDTMPTLVPFTVTKTGKQRFIKLEDDFGGPNGIDTFVEVSIKFTDLPGKDYYRLVVKDSLYEMGFAGRVSEDQIFGFGQAISTDPVFNTSIGFDPLQPQSERYVNPNISYFTDVTFNNSTKDILIWFPIGNLSALFGGGIPEEFFTRRQRKYFALQHLSSAQYLRLISVEQAGNSGTPFTQPSLLFTNTRGGFGIMACSTSTIDSIKLK